MFDNAEYDNGRTKLTLNWAFIAGSSKHGNAWRANVGSNFDVAINLQKNNQRIGQMYDRIFAQMTL